MNRPDSRFLETAHTLGAKLCRDAIWAGHRCNWVGAATLEVDGGRRVPAQRACGVDLFSGTSGIALFLARLFAATGERVFAVTAEGAIRQALSRLDDLPPSKRIGFYTGLTGVAYVLVAVADLLSVTKFAAMARLILEDVAREDARAHGLTLARGSDVVIPALLHIHRAHPNDSVWRLARDHGERLLDPLVETPAHSAWSLLELWHATGHDAFRRAAERALACSPADLPVDAGAQLRTPDAETTTWLYRPSGVGLVKLRAFELLGDERYLAEARSILSLVAELLSSSSDAAPKVFSLAEGQPGAAELLLRARCTIDDESYVAAAERVGHRGVDFFGNDDRPWPCSVPDGAEAPGLMNGLAGIGYFYLRLSDAVRTPSLLLMSTRSGTL
jgi:lantibiotic modifying enzyme